MITPDKLLPQLALLSTLFVFAGAGAALVWLHRRVWQQNRYVIVLCAVRIAIYVPPIIWLDPFRPRYGG